MISAKYIDLALFTKKKLINKGFCSSIYLVEKIDTNELYCSKVLHEQMDFNCPNKNQEIYRDMNCFINLKHPSIVNIVGISPCDFDNSLKPVIITKYYKNKSLKEMIDLSKISLADNWFDTEKLITIYGIASGMAFLHSKQIIHRDLKPSNILLDDNLYPLISDFDFLIKINHEKRLDVGTRNYMAPELWKCCENSKSSDVYSFGIIIYEIMTDYLPFEKSFSTNNYCKPKINSKFYIPEAYRNLIESCWNIDPSKRPTFDQIVNLLKNDKRFIFDKYMDEDFQDYVDYIEYLTNKINKEEKDEKITKLTNIFNGDHEKMKYYIIQKAIHQLNLHIKYENIKDLPQKINDLKKNMHQLYTEISKSFPKNQTLDDLKLIDKSIDNEYYKIKSQPCLMSNFLMLNDFISIIEKSETDPGNIPKIRDQILNVIENHKGEILFNRLDIFRNLFSSKELSQILETLRAIQKSPKFESIKKEKNEDFSVLYSYENVKYSKSLANILRGNCFFIMLYGKSQCTRSFLEKVINKNLEKYQNDDITIYGPVDLLSFSKTSNEINSNLYEFNGCLPNLYFFEVSEDSYDSLYSKWCQFILFISHFIIFCSNVVNRSEIKKFKNLLKDSYSDCEIINCLPFSKDDLEYDFLPKANLNMDIELFDESKFRDYLVESLAIKKKDFLPSTTVASVSHLIMEKNLKQIYFDKENFKKEIIQDYSHYIHDITIEYFHNLVQKEIEKISEKCHKEEIQFNFCLEEKCQELLEKTNQFMFSMIYPELWNNNQIIQINKVVNCEAKNDFYSSVVNIKQIELIAELIRILKKYINSNSSSIILFAYANSILQQIKTFTPSINVDSIPQSKKKVENLISLLVEAYNNLVQSSFENVEISNATKILSEKIYEFLFDHPTSNDEMYGKFYHQLYQEMSIINQYFAKSFNFVLNIRKVIDKYRPQIYQFEVDEISFNYSNIKLLKNSLNIELVPATTCSELYGLIRKYFKLTIIPFHITRSTYNKFNKPIYIEVFNNNTSLAQLNSNDFVIHYGNNIHSTKSYIESLIVQKTIKIADDLLIKSSSKDSDFLVKYDINHKGWFDVPFEIQNKSQKLLDEGVLLYFSLNSNEISFVQNGNTIVHKYRKDNEWIIDENPVFVTFPNCETAIVLLTHCSDHMISTIKTETYDLIPPAFHDDRYSRNWENENENIEYKRGGMPYYLPVGFNSAGIKVNNFSNNTCVAFHGTLAISVAGIIEKGFLLPSQYHGEREGHYKYQDTHFDIPYFGNAIFVTPSIKYASTYSRNEILAESNDTIAVNSGHVDQKRIRVIILQVRVKPKSFRIFPNTTIYDVYDNHYNIKELEWRIPQTSDVYPYRVLEKHYSLDDYENSIAVKRVQNRI